MSHFAVIVEFRLKPGMRAVFRALIDANAKASVAAEAGCFRFDVLEPDNRPDDILLYEIYEDRAAFDAHLASTHYRAFDRTGADLCLGKTVVPCTLVCEG